MNILTNSILDHKPECVLLDLDNTFYDYEKAHVPAMKAVQAYAKKHLNIGESIFNRCFNDARDELKARLGKTASSHNRLLYFQRTIEKAGLASQPLSALQMEQAYWGEFFNNAILFAETLEFLDDLRIAGIPSVIVTDLTSQIQLRKILYFGINSYVDWIVTSEEAGSDKPHSSIFHLSLAKIGGVEGAIWMVGDNPVNDIMGAKKSLKHCYTIQKLHKGISVGKSKYERPDATFKEFSEIRSLLSSITMTNK